MEMMSLKVVTIELSRDDVKLALIALEFLSAELRTTTARRRVIKALEKTKAFCSFNYDSTKLDGDPHVSGSPSSDTIFCLHDKFFDAFAKSLWAEHDALGLPEPVLPDHIVDLECELLPPEVYHE